MALVQELQKLGLSDKEAKVYLANLELGEASVQDIAKKAGVNRATTYVILNSLLKKGLCSTYEANKKTHYAAVEPESLRGLFELQKKEIEERQKYFQTLVPQLKLIDNKNRNKPAVKFFEGKQGLLNCLNEFVSKFKKDEANRTAFMFYSNDDLDKLFKSEDRKEHRNLRIKNKVRVKSIYTSEKTTLPSTSDGIRIKVPSKEFPVDCDIAVYGDMVRILVLGKNPSGILIRDQHVAKSMAALFKLAWEAAEARNKK